MGRNHTTDTRLLQVQIVKEIAGIMQTLKMYIDWTIAASTKPRPLTIFYKPPLKITERRALKVSQKENFRKTGFNQCRAKQHHENRYAHEMKRDDKGKEDAHRGRPCSKPDAWALAASFLRSLGMRLLHRRSESCPRSSRNTRRLRASNALTRNVNVDLLSSRRKW